MRGPIVLLQLPVPEVVPQPVTGCVQMAAANLLLHTSRVAPELAARVRIFPDRLVRRLGDQALVDALAGLNPAVVGLTLTVWNVERSALLVRRLKERIPEVRIWVGGPEFAEGSWALVPGKLPYDQGIRGEGEAAFLRLLTAWSKGESPGAELRQDLPLESLATIHDPYISGLVSMESDRSVLAELWRGCRYGCTFCAYHQGRRTPASRPPEQMRDLLRWAGDAGAKELYLLDPSLDQRPDLEGFLRDLAQANRTGLKIFAELRAEAIDHPRARALALAGVTRVEVGLQTVNREALKQVGRGLNRARFLRGVRALTEHGVEVKVDLMVGLPWDSLQGVQETLDFLGDLEQQIRLQVFQTQILPGTRLRAEALIRGWNFQAAPPYHFLHGQAWSEGQVDQALELVDSFPAQGGSLPELPVFALPDLASSPMEGTPYPDCDCLLQLSFNLDHQGGREALAQEDFTKVGRSFVLWLKTDHPHLHLELCRRALERIQDRNPFIGLGIVVEQPPGSPLDLLELLVRETRFGPRPSTYLDSLLGYHAPEREVYLSLPPAGRFLEGDDWLEAAGELASVLWIRPAKPMVQQLELLEQESYGEDLNLITFNEDPTDDQLLSLARTRAWDRLVLAPPPLQWRYLRLLQSQVHQDW